MRSHGPIWIPIAAVTLGVVVLTTGPLYRIRTWWSYEDPLESDATVVAVQALVAIAGLVVLASGDRVRRVNRVAGLLCAALLGWLLLSVTWSLDPGETAREVLLVAGTLAAGAAAAASLGARPLVWSLWAGTQVGLAWSALAIWTVASGSQDEVGFWVGIYFNRNSLALVAAIGLLTSALLALSLIDRDGTTRPSMLPLMLLGAAGLADLWLLLGSESLTPLLAVGAATGAVLLSLGGRRLRRRGVAVAPIVGGAGLAASAVATLGWALRTPLAEAVGRDADFSGRDALWRVSWDWFTDRPLLGHGYLAAWNDADFLADILAERGEILTSAHNSFVEVLLGGGLPGAVLLVSFVVAVFWSVGRVAVEGDRIEHAWPLAVFAFVLVEQLSETLLVGGHITVAMLGALLVSWSWPAARRNDAAGSPRARPDRAAAADANEPQPASARATGDPR